MKLLAKITFFISLGTLTLSFFFIERLPEKHEIIRKLLNEPIQQPLTTPEFTMHKNGIRYTIKPLFAYEIYGLVVTYHHSNSIYDISHKEWKDYLNIKDLALIWGANLRTDDYLKVKFWHADWTGYYRYPESVVFHDNSFSNNHILTDNAAIHKLIMNTKKGDQVFIKGYLAEYRHDQSNNFKRGTSTRRDDTNNGACETIYVTEYKILKAANTHWRNLFNFSKLLLILSSLYLFFTTFFFNRTGTYTR